MDNCVFENRCYNSGTDKCDVCQYNPDACTRDFFEWNERGEEPTEQELDNAIES